MFTKSQLESFIYTYSPLRIVYGTSRAWGMEGQNTVTLHTNGRRYTQTGGGYDMTGSALGDWLTNCPEFLAGCKNLCPDKFYGLHFYSEKKEGKTLKRYRPGCRIVIDGRCGEAAVMRIFQRVTGADICRVSKSSREENYVIRELIK